MSFEVRAITEPLVLGEGPHWDHDQQALFFVDIPGKSLHKYSPATDVHTKTKFDFGSNFIIPVEGKKDHYVVGSKRQILIIRWDGEEGSMVDVVRELVEIDQERPNYMMNDAKVDPRGRLYTGAFEMADNFESIKPEGFIYRISSESGKVVTKAVGDKVALANGLAWDLERKAFYYVDSLEKNVRRYDYDAETGELSNLAYIFDLEKNNLKGFFDGMTIDTDGNLWIANFDNSAVAKVDPRTGKLLEKIVIPVNQVTSVTFGGANYDVLFVTTGAVSWAGKDVPPPPSGATYMVTGLGVKGQPNRSFKL